MSASTCPRACLALAAALACAGAFAARPAPEHPAVAVALGHLQARSLLATASASDEAFEATDLVVDADGSQHVRLRRQYKGLPVIGGDLIVRSHADGRLHGVIQSAASGLSLDTRPRVDATSARATASALASHIQASPAAPTLVVHARGLQPRLAWDVRLDGQRADRTPSREHLVLDARTGELLDRWDEIHTVAANGLGHSLYAGDVALTTDYSAAKLKFQLMDPTRGHHYVVTMKNSLWSEYRLWDSDNVWGNGLRGNAQTVAVDAAYGQQVTWDYYQTVHGRNGIADDGRGGYSRVHHDVSYDNAFWDDSCFCMTYGDGDTLKPLVSLDVAGHEMTHGVTAATAGLIYSGESGGLNEATSDIFGSMVEFHAANARDPGDYLIGEKLYANGSRFLRDMAQPSRDGESADCWYAGVGRLDVHLSSGVANHFFYLLAEGATGGPNTSSKLCLSGDTRVATGTGAFTGIGRTKAARIWYRALTTKMLSNETYRNARAHTIAAANELYGVGSAEALAVAQAWTLVGRAP